MRFDILEQGLAMLVAVRDALNNEVTYTYVAGYEKQGLSLIHIFHGISLQAVGTKHAPYTPQCQYDTENGGGGAWISVL